MWGIEFSDVDRQQMDTLGITESQVLDQMGIFRKTSFSIRLNRPCTPDDGVHRILPAEAEKCLQIHETAAGGCRFSKFIPASGAATRMFQSLLQIYYMPHFLEVEELYRRAQQGVAVASDFLRFLEGIYKFPFVDELREVIERDGFSLDEMVNHCRYRNILDYLLTERGLNYGALPKALLKFHRYADGCRTAFEEHLAESAFYMDSRPGRCKVHFTVSPEHEERFRRLMRNVRTRYEEVFGVGYDICYSFQKTSTNTIAVDMENRPFRDRYGRLHFRPGGHGALLENLNDLRGDIVYIKNVDNVTPDRLKETVIRWKKILAGCLVDIQNTVHGFLRDMKSGGDTSTVVGNAEGYARDKLMIHFPAGFELWSGERKLEFLFEKLNRPIRVCGVVPNAGEPGGAPFWVEGKDGELSIQIVEKAQVDFDSPEQERIWMASTHFNPVDVVCSLRDFEGRPFDLRKYVDGDAVFISKKSKDGKDLKALELPGLWNGAMADWITYIVEVPRVTFNPVKSVYDLLRAEHQPEDRSEAPHKTALTGGG